MNYLPLIGRDEELFGDDIENCSNLVQEIVTNSRLWKCRIRSNYGYRRTMRLWV